MPPRNRKEKANADRLQRDLARLRRGRFPTYVPVKKRRGQKGRRYRNVDTGEIVTEYYYSKVLSRHLANTEDISYHEGTYNAYRQHLRRARRLEVVKHHDLIESYELRQETLGNPMSATEIAEDAHFQQLIEELKYWSTWERIFQSPENFRAYTGLEMDSVYDRLLVERTGKTPEQLRVEAYNAIISNPEYKRVLTQLGRRDPADDRDIGTYGPGTIKAVVVPYYQGLLEG
jgi:hypothetical protein